MTILTTYAVMDQDWEPYVIFNSLIEAKAWIFDQVVKFGEDVNDFKLGISFNGGYKEVSLLGDELEDTKYIIINDECYIVAQYDNLLQAKGYIRAHGDKLRLGTMKIKEI